MKKMPAITECRECGSEKLSWTPTMRPNSSVQDGRLRLHDVSCVFVLGCLFCSETLAVVPADAIADHLNKAFEVSEEEIELREEEATADVQH